jgi:hypothetical protein
LRSRHLRASTVGMIVANRTKLFWPSSTTCDEEVRAPALFSDRATIVKPEHAHLWCPVPEKLPDHVGHPPRSLRTDRAAYGGIGTRTFAQPVDLGEMPKPARHAHAAVNFAVTSPPAAAPVLFGASYVQFCKCGALQSSEPLIKNLKLGTA